MTDFLYDIPVNPPIPVDPPCPKCGEPTKSFRGFIVVTDHYCSKCRVTWLTDFRTEGHPLITMDEWRKREKKANA